MTTTDGQVKWKIKDMRTHHMCGEIVALVVTPPNYEHLLLCNGQTINADDYPELVAALGTNVLPNLNGRVLQGAETAGEYKEAGLPNITGRRVASWGGGDSGGRGYTTGCFKQDADKDIPPTINGENWNGDGNGTGFAFDASRSNPIYGKSTTVQPPAYTVRYYICYG